jgi:hypothetical protein
MPRVVADTNILISAFISSGAPRKVFMRVLEGRLILVASNETLEEFRDVISREKFGLPEEVATEIVAVVEAASVVVEPKQKLKVVERDPKDDPFLECAIAGGAEYIVTGDNDLLSLEEYEGVKIVGPEELLDLLQ